MLLFVALGHFERKGLPLVLESLRNLNDLAVRLIVVGGLPDLISEYRRRASALGLASRVRFEGMQSDLRRYYWAADAFVFPSCYEVFPLVALEAAAAGLPLLVTHLNGVEEMLADRQNGLLLERSVAGVTAGIQQWLELGDGERSSMRRLARQSAQRYSVDRFVAAWRIFYEELV